MKFRRGFVSNSSTTSFCIYGAEISQEKEGEIYGNKTGLKTFYGDPNYDRLIYAGIEWCDIGLDETSHEFIDRVEELLSRFLEDPKCRTIQESYYDG